MASSPAGPPIAPELRELLPNQPELVMTILRPHTGDVYTLTCLSMTNKEWRRRVFGDKVLWSILSLSRPRKLNKAACDWRLSCGCAGDYRGPLIQLEDEQLAALVARSRSDDGKFSFLRELDLTGQMRLTAAGVLSALAGLEGSLSTLTVCGLRCSPDDKDASDDVVEALSAFLKPDGEMDVTELRTCDAPRVLYPANGEFCEETCDRLCTDDYDALVCHSCSLTLCPYCSSALLGRHGKNAFMGMKPLCEHLCSACGCAYDDAADDLSPCSQCEHGERFCRNCCSYCAGCDQVFCEHCESLAVCSGRCSKAFCEDCAELSYCDLLCYRDYFCEDCAPEHLMTRANWHEKLAAFTGSAAVAPAALERLHEYAEAEQEAIEYSYAEELRICKACALTETERKTWNGPAVGQRIRHYCCRSSYCRARSPSPDDLPTPVVLKPVVSEAEELAAAHLIR